MSPDVEFSGGREHHSVIFVVSGPSGSGKETAIHYLMAKHGVERVVTLTTREQRKGEVAGQPYEFVDNREFVRRGLAGELLEFVRTYGTNAYASPASLLGEDGASAECVLEMDPQGYVELKAKSNRKVVGIFLVPRSLDTLERRIATRSSVSDLDARLQVVSSQFIFSTLYEYCIINDEISDLYALLDAIVLIERARARAAQTSQDLVDEARRREYARLLDETNE